MHQGPSLDREVLAAVAAPEGLGLKVGDVGDVDAMTERADRTVGSALGDKPRLGLLLGVEHFDGIHQGDAGSVGFPGAGFSG